MTEIFLLINLKTYYMYGLVLFNVRNTCCNLRLIKLITEDFWLLDLNYLLSVHFCKTVDMSNLQQCDPDLKLLYSTKKVGQTPDKNVLKDTSPACRYYLNIIFKENLIYKKFVSKNGEHTFSQLLITRSLRDDVLQHLHKPPWCREDN